VTDLIPAAKALIGWNLNEARRVTDVFVIRDGRDKEWMHTGVPAEWRKPQYKHGACFTDWLKKGERTMTPEWVFSEIVVFYGCADSKVMEQAIAAFAQIRECAWARAMVPGEPSNSKKPFWSAG
jgi:hypothetical protein